MPEFKSAYDIYFAAGADPGKYEASKFGIQDIWSGIEFGEKSTEARLEHISNVTDSLMASVELGSTLYQGTLDRREFEANLETVQASEAKKAFQMLPEAERAVGFSEYIKSDVGKEWYGGFRAEAVGSPGLFGKKEGDETWEDLEWWEKLGQEKRYKFGGEDILTRSQVSATALSSAYGIETDFDVFRQQLGEGDRGEEQMSMADEVTAGTGLTGGGQEGIVSDIGAAGESSTGIGTRLTALMTEWQSEGPSVENLQGDKKTEMESKMKEAMVQMKALGEQYNISSLKDIGDVESDWEKHGSLAWGRKTKAAYEELYNLWNPEGRTW